MWSASTFTLVFRGLLVFHRVERPGRGSWFEIGVLPTDGHFLRISTFKHCVLAGVFPLKPHVSRAHPFWRLDVDNPVGGGVSIHTSGATFNRLTHKDNNGLYLMTEDERDFRWITDLESDEFYNRDLTEELDTSPLIPILRIFHGVFYTRLKSIQLNRKKGNGPKELFGSIAGAIACDIPILDGRVRLIEEGTGVEIFPFPVEPDTIYEFSNAPPDIGPDSHSLTAAAAQGQQDDAAAAAQGQQANAAPHAANMPPDEDHFQAYYKLFIDPNVERFSFEKPGSAPAPDPALCGATFLSRRSASLK